MGDKVMTFRNTDLLFLRSEWFCQELKFKSRQFKWVPESPGVYLLVNWNEEILYIGHSKNLEMCRLAHGCSLIQLLEQKCEYKYIYFWFKRAKTKEEAREFEKRLVRRIKPKLNKYLK